jgi:hypothetical protein
MVRELTDAQLAKIRQDISDWQQQPAPCGIPHDHVYNPCLPQREPDGTLWCCMCGAEQEPLTRAEKPAANKNRNPFQETNPA